MPTRKPQKRKLGELGSTSTKRVSLGDHSEQVYLPAQMKWVDIAEWVQSDDHFCLNIAPFFVDTFDGFRTNCIGVSSMDYFPAMKVCNLGESQVLDPKAPTTLVYLVSLVFGRLCVRSAPEITKDLKNTRQIIFATLPWNFATYEQVVGRGVRFKSHESLPEKDRHVDVYTFLQTKEPSKLFNDSNSMISRFASIDDYLWSLIEAKRTQKEGLDGLLSHLSVK